MLPEPPRRSSVPALPDFTVPWSIGTAIASLLVSSAVAYIPGIIVGSLVVALVLHTRAAIDKHTIELNFIIYQFLALGVLISAGWLILRRFQAGLDVLGFRFPDWRQLLIILATAVPVYFIVVALVVAAFDTFFPGYHLQGNTAQITGGAKHLAVDQKLMLVVLLVIEAPVVEETLFRGIMFQGLRHFFRRWLSNAWAVGAAAATSGLVFGLYHFEPRTLPILALLGVALAYVFQYSRSIYGSMLLHGIINGIVTVALITST